MNHHPCQPWGMGLDHSCHPLGLTSCSVSLQRLQTIPGLSAVLYPWCLTARALGSAAGLGLVQHGHSGGEVGGGSRRLASVPVTKLMPLGISSLTTTS